MSKENFATRVINRVAEEYGVEPGSLSQHRAKLEAAAEKEAGITDEELDLLLSGKSDDAGRDVQAKYPELNAVSLSIVEALENQDLEDDEEDEDDEDEDDEDEEDEDDDDEDEDD